MDGPPLVGLAIKKEDHVGLHRTHSGGAVRTAWELEVEMEKYCFTAHELDEGAATLVKDLANKFEKVRLEVVWQWAMHFDFLEKEFKNYLCEF